MCFATTSSLSKSSQSCSYVTPPHLLTFRMIAVNSCVADGAAGSENCPGLVQALSCQSTTFRLPEGSEQLEPGMKNSKVPLFCLQHT